MRGEEQGERAGFFSLQARGRRRVWRAPRRARANPALPTLSPSLSLSPPPRLTWYASSRVWQTMMAPTSPSTGSSCCSTDRTKTAVLPMPDLAWHRTSMPRIAWGMHSCGPVGREGERRGGGGGGREEGGVRGQGRGWRPAEGDGRPAAGMLAGGQGRSRARAWAHAPAAAPPRPALPHLLPPSGTACGADARTPSRPPRPHPHSPPSLSFFFTARRPPRTPAARLTPSLAPPPASPSEGCSKPQSTMARSSSGLRRKSLKPELKRKKKARRGGGGGKAVRRVRLEADASARPGRRPAASP